jgi:hypothetical protein
MNAIMKSELDRVAEVAVSHGRDDPALDVFLSFVATLEPPPEAATLEPAALRIGKLRLAEALDRPGERRLGACRMLTASADQRRPVVVPLPPAPASFEDDLEPTGFGSSRRAGTLTLERPAVETSRRLPDMFEALVQAIRFALSLLA